MNEDAPIFDRLNQETRCFSYWDIITWNMNTDIRAKWATAFDTRGIYWRPTATTATTNVTLTVY